MKCLVADDNADLARLWALTLSADGHDVTVCTDGHEAVNKMRVKSFDLLVLDLFMPGGGALSLAKVAVYNNPEAEVLIVTGAEAFAYGELLEMGENIAMVLRKPVSPEDLRSCVAHIEHKRAAAPAPRPAVAHIAPPAPRHPLAPQRVQPVEQSAKRA